MNRIVRLTGVGLLAALVLGACSSGNSNVSGAQETVIKKADSICSDAQDAVGRVLGDNPAADRDAIESATNKLMAIKAPSEDQTTWTLFVESTNNLWISLDDVAQALDPSVNDHARAQAAVATITMNNKNVIKYAKAYQMTDCAMGFGRSIAIPK